MSMAVTEGVRFQEGNRKRGMKIVFTDVRRAYLRALSRGEVCVKLPHEDCEEGMCGRQSRAMYGTRDTAQSWKYEPIEWL